MKFSRVYLLPLFLLLIFSLSACGKKNEDQPSKPISDNKSDVVEESLDNEESYFSSSVIDMFKKEKPLQCSVEIENEEATMSAVYYFDNKGERIRVEMNTVDKGQGMRFNSVSIIKDGWNYFWDDLMNKEGMKMKLEEGETEDEAGDEIKQDTVDMDEVFDFKCKSWNIDDSKFDLPNDKTFKDLSSLMNGFNPSVQTPANQSNSTNPSAEIPAVGEKIDVCSYCDMIQGVEARQECLNSCR